MGWKMPVVLSCMFCLMINCLSACFDRISALSAGCGCGIRPVRGTRNFGRQNILSGNRCKFTSMFICTSLARPCASVACCRTKFLVPLTAFLGIRTSADGTDRLSNIGKTVFTGKSKICSLELRYFISKTNILWITGLF